MAITKDIARNAEAEVRRANAEADALEAETRAARERAVAAARTAQSVGQEFARISASQRQMAGNELEELRAAADAVLAEKPDKTRVMHEARLYARSMLANYVLGDPGPDPQLRDVLWGSLHGLQGRVIALMGRLEDEKLYDAADVLECRLHRAAVARLRWLAGEE